MMDWTPTVHEGKLRFVTPGMPQLLISEFSLATQPNSQLSFPPFSRVQNYSKTTRKPQRSSPLAGPVVSNDRSAVSSNEAAHAPRTESPLSVSQDADPSLSLRSKSFLGLSRPASIVSLYPPSPQPYSSRHRPSTAPTPRSKSPQIDMQSIERPSSVHSPTKITRSEWVSLSKSQGSRSVVSGSSFVSDSSGSRSRAPHMPTALAGPSTRTVSVVLEVEAEAEEGVKDDPDATQSRTSAMLSPKSIPNPVVPLDNSWYVANEYSETPKFSRLGLAGSSVVMPVSAKERKRQISQRGSVASFQSNKSGIPASNGSESADIINNAGLNVTGYSSSSSTTSDSKGQNGTIKSPWSNNRDTVHKPEWLSLPPTHTHSRGTPLPSATPTFSSAASSASSLPLTTALHSGTSSTPSVVSCATACTSVHENEKTATEDQYQHHTKDISPTELKNKLVKRKSVLARMKSWRMPSQSGQRKHPPSDAGYSLNDSRDERGALSISSERTPSGEKDSVVYIEPPLSSQTNDVKKNDVDVVVTPVPKSRSESTIQAIPGNGKRERRIGSVRKIWNVLTRRTLRT
jgi:hypothetical protein